jgi:four helix bundle protein
MKEKSIIQEKSMDFAVRIVSLYKVLVNDKKEYVLSKQILRSGTSIGANIREAHNAESKADFVHKLGIAQKETDETLYWLELLHKTDYLSFNDFETYSSDASEILKILRSIILTTKQRNNS